MGDFGTLATDGFPMHDATELPVLRLIRPDGRGFVDAMNSNVELRGITLGFYFLIE